MLFEKPDESPLAVYAGRLWGMQLLGEAMLWERDDVLPDDRNEVEYIVEEINSLPGGDGELWDDVLDVLSAGHAEELAADKDKLVQLCSLYSDYFYFDSHAGTRRILPGLPLHIAARAELLDWLADAVEASGIMPLLRAHLEKGVPADDLVA